MADFDISFMENWVNKKAKGCYCRADVQARSLAVLYCNKLGQKTYSEVSPLLGLPGVRQVQRLKRKLQENQNYMPGINEWALQKVAMRENKPLQNSVDGTRVIRAIELYSDKYLIGEEFPADVRLYPKESDLPVFEDAEQIMKYIYKYGQTPSMQLKPTVLILLIPQENCLTY